MGLLLSLLLLLGLAYFAPLVRDPGNPLFTKNTRIPLLMLLLMVGFLYWLTQKRSAVTPISATPTISQTVE